MFELADRLVGVYKTNDVSKSIAINPRAIADACGVASGQEPVDKENAAMVGKRGVAPSAV